MPAPTNVAIILAGGNGSRLQGLTRLVSGDDRPKQFCRLFRSQTLLAATRERLSPTVAPECTFYVVTSHHEPFYRDELADVGREQVIEQPSNRGTTIAFAHAVARAASLTDDAIVGFFPADHHYDDADALRETLDEAYRAARAVPDRVFLVGAEADRAETEYGWIEPGGRVHGMSEGRIREVAGFVEKPSQSDAEVLFRRRCLWNTFVLVGHLRAFRKLLGTAAPAEYANVAGAVALGEPARASAIAEVYAAAKESDFSREVLAAHPQRLAVITLGAAGWTDLGQSARVLQVMSRCGLATSAEILAAC